MQNSGVTLRVESQHFASVNDTNPCVASIPYFGFIDEIWELNYVKFIVCVFKCKWVDSNTGVRTDDIGFTLVDLKKLGYHNDPFIMAEQARQIMGSPPASTTPPPPPSPPSPPPPPPTSDASASTSAVKRTRKASRLRSLSTRPPGVERSVVHVDPATGKADGPHKKKLRTYLGIVARDKVDITYENWKEVPTAQKDLIWEDIQAEFDIPEAFDNRTKRKPWGRDGGSLNQYSRGNRPLHPIRTVSRTLSVTNTASARKSGPNFARLAETLLGSYDVRMKAQAIQKQNTAPHILSRGGYDYLEHKLLAEKTKKKIVDGVIDPPSPVRRHVKWKMARTKKTGETMTEAAKEIAEKIDSFEEQATQGSFVPHGRQDVLAAAIGRPEHPGRVRGIGAGVTIKQYFGSAPRTSRSASSLPPNELH
ncbi:hypothetical protein GmHk_01G001638 [Glycine max]|nr:hypothetical protein GmHk_01G001638 [Glycine max]